MTCGDTLARVPTYMGGYMDSYEGGNGLITKFARVNKLAGDVRKEKTCFIIVGTVDRCQKETQWSQNTLYCHQDIR